MHALLKVKNHNFDFGSIVVGLLTFLEKIICKIRQVCNLQVYNYLKYLKKEL